MISPIPSIDYLRILPEMILSVFGMLVMLADPFIKDKSDRKLDVISVTGILGALAATFYMAQNPGDAFFHMVRADNFCVFFHVVVLLVALDHGLDVARVPHGPQACAPASATP